MTTPSAQHCTHVIQAWTNGPKHDGRCAELAKTFQLPEPIVRMILRSHATLQEEMSGWMQDNELAGQDDCGSEDDSDTIAPELLTMICKKADSAMPDGEVLDTCISLLEKAEKLVLVLLIRQIYWDHARVRADAVIGTAKRGA